MKADTSGESRPAVVTSATTAAPPFAQAPQHAAPPTEAGLPATPEDVAAAPDWASETDSGIKHRLLRPGAGTHKPGRQDTVRVHYSGWTLDGKLFDSSVKRGEPSSFPLNQVIRGWTEGLQLMVEGEKRRFWIPGSLAYGENAQGGRPSGTLVFDVDLLKVLPKPVAPPDVSGPPASAQREDSGLVSRKLADGSGSDHPQANSLVTVHYSGWTPDGKLFDSSLTRGEPASFRLAQVIPGWTEGVQLMVKGEKRRFWIPAALAYGENPGAGMPGGMLVFDVTLIDFQ